MSCCFVLYSTITTLITLLSLIPLHPLTTYCRDCGDSSSKQPLIITPPRATDQTARSYPPTPPSTTTASQRHGNNINTNNDSNPPASTSPPPLPLPLPLPPPPLIRHHQHILASSASLLQSVPPIAAQRSPGEERPGDRELSDALID
jgi:hypothetical protein